MNEIESVSAKEMKVTLAAVLPGITRFVEGCVDAYASALGRAFNDDRSPDIVRPSESNRATEPSYETTRCVECAGVTYTARISIRADDSMKPYVTVAGWFGWPGQERLVEFRTESADRWETCSLTDSELANWLEQRLEMLATRASEVAILVGPLLTSLHHQTKGVSLLVVAVPRDGDIRIRFE